MHQLGLVFQIILLVAIAAGAFVSWDRRTGEDSRDSNLGRRDSDGAAVDITEPTSS